MRQGSIVWFLNSDEAREAVLWTQKPATPWAHDLSECFANRRGTGRWDTWNNHDAGGGGFPRQLNPVTASLNGADQNRCGQVILRDVLLRLLDGSERRAKESGRSGPAGRRVRPHNSALDQPAATTFCKPYSACLSNPSHSFWIVQRCS